MLGSISLLFFLSGATSLIYETVWIRVLALGVGSTSAAMSLVLALFFLGLSLGSWLSGNRLATLKRPLRAYAILEGLIGVVGLVIIYGLVHFHRLLAYLPLEGSLSWLGTTMKFLFVGAFLFVPTVAMGATLPMVVRSLDVPERDRSRLVSLLYAVNTLGGVLGALVASFSLIPKWGVLVTNQVSAAGNLILFVAGLWLDRRLRAVAVSAPVETEPLVLGRPRWALILVSGVCGFSSLASEVVWNKYLGIFLGNNIYGLGLVLGLYLMGIAVGAMALYLFLPRLGDPRRLFWGLLLALPFTLALSSYLFNWIPLAANVIGYYATGKADLLVTKTLLSALLLLPSTCILGALFPLTVHLVADGGNGTSRAVGVAYAVNTVGAILGSCLAGLVLIPLWGSSTTIKLASVALLLATGALLYEERHRSSIGRRAAVAALSLVVVLSLGALDFRNILKSAYVQQIDSQATLTDSLRYFSKAYEEFTWIREGETSVISLSHDPKDGEHYRSYLRLKTNGLNESVYVTGSLEQLPRYEALLGLLPYLFTDAPKSAFVVGYGGGYTVDLLTSFPIEKVHVVELEKAILEAADQVYRGHNPINKRKSLDLTIEDARFVLATKQRAPLDIIVSQPSHSWLAGAANLFTREFFEIVRENLAPNGVFSQWLNLYNMDVVTLKSVLGTFFQVFPHGAVFSGQGDQEMILIGSVAPLKFHSEKAEKIASSPLFQKKLAGVPFSGPSDVLAHFALGRNRILELTAGAATNTDINAYAEARQSRSFYKGIAAEDIPQTFLTNNYRGGFVELLDDTEDWGFKVLVSLQQTGQHEKFFTYLTSFEERYESDPSRYAQLGYLCLKAQRYESARRYLEGAFQRDRNTTNFNLLLSAYAEMELHDDVLKLSRRFPRLKDRVTECYVVHSQLAQKKLEATKVVVSQMIGDIPGYTAACGDFFNRVIGDYFFQRKNFQTAIAWYEAFEANYHRKIDVLRRLSVSYMKANDWRNASRIAQDLVPVAESQRERLRTLAQFYDERKLPDDAKVLFERVRSLSAE